MPTVAGVGVLAVVIAAGLSGRGGASSADTVPTTANVASVASSAVISAQPIVVDTDPAVVKTNLAHTISKGNAGDDVKAVQQRLTDLGFAPGPIDGLFGSGTQQAVWAYEKLILKTPRSEAKGKVTQEIDLKTGRPVENPNIRYETGKTKPPLALVKLLKVLERHPDLLNEVRAS